MSDFEDGNLTGAVAIIGMNGRFPGADNMDEFWQNLYNGVESVKFFNRDELVRMGIDEYLLDNPRFVAADAILDGMDLFDAAFFDYSAREAEIMDPQHRQFLESAWEVLESAGYNSELYKGRIAVYAGANLSGYMIRNLYSNPGLVENVGTFKIMIANSQDFLATRVSYKMNLTGPSVNVNTLCSSSMVAVHMACQNLQNYSCDIALAGGVSFQISRNEAFFYQEGGIGSGDGHCRAFDSRANGTVSGSGLAVVVLKRLEDAIADGDYIHAVIRGTGLNNDGSEKNSYTAPNADGQAECIAEAIAMSGVDPETITYIDAHGTGTDLGDPIEISALTKAYRAYTRKKQFCAIGSVKTNIGHLVTAGGLASLVKTVLAMKHRALPPSLNFEEPNPKIDFVNSPFYINHKLTKWESEGHPLRAGVSSFGIGGTNTHVILEEAPESKPSGKSPWPWQLIVLSAKTETALEKMTENLAEFVSRNKELNTADIAFTLQAGRRNFNCRRMLLCRDLGDLEEKLKKPAGEYAFTRFRKPKEQPVVFMFPGEGAFYGNMGRELYETEPVYKANFDRCSEVYKNIAGTDIRRVLYPDVPIEEGLERHIPDEVNLRAMIFSTEYSLARLWLEFGIEPESMIGEGAGEYAAACLAGVMSEEDALMLVSAGVEDLPRKARKAALKAPQIPVISGLTGSRIKDSEAAEPNYWIGQRHATQIRKGLLEIMKDTDRLLLELGPGKGLVTRINELAQPGIEPDTIYTMPAPDSKETDAYALLRSIGQFWLAGGKVDWNRLPMNKKRHRIPLPTYPFERQRYWIEPGKRSEAPGQTALQVNGKEEINNSIVSSGFVGGAINMTFSLDTHGPEEQKKQQLEDMLLFRERLVEFCKNDGGISRGMEISPVSLVKKQTPAAAGTGNGVKLNKVPRPELETAYAAPRNETERIIVERWQEVLGYESIGIHDDFFTLGGHSLLAAAIATDLGKVFKVQIPMRELFEATTAEEVAKLVEAYQWAVQGQEEAAADSDADVGFI